jgi:transitional endoplasmic reticulum ATPase
MRPGRLDQLIYIPMPDYESRLSILTSILRKTPCSRDVDLAYLAAQTEKFSGADLTEICQRAAKNAIRENIQRDMEREQIRADAEADGVIMDDDGEEEDLVPEIMPRHFEDAVRNARRSVSDRDLAQYSSFASNLQQSRAQMNQTGASLGGFTFPTRQPTAGGAGTTGGGVDITEEDEEDLYS